MGFRYGRSDSALQFSAKILQDLPRCGIPHLHGEVIVPSEHTGRIFGKAYRDDF